MLILASRRHPSFAQAKASKAQHQASQTIVSYGFCHLRMFIANRHAASPLHPQRTSLQVRWFSRRGPNYSLYRKPVLKNCRRVELTPDPDTFEKYRDTPPISSAILWQKYALLLAESSLYTTDLHHDTPPICIAILLQKY